ncbi:MAG: hypothetical protein H6702_01445 [Myxococcales bacterium]|nr:hypothetical protein [Myxococcales bacterium]
MAPVDLRSDTVTRPSPEMRAAMAAAEVGDDVFGEDPTVQALEARAADWVGHDAALFLPSGTMGNQIAMLAHCQRGDDVVVGEGAHSVLYESGGGGALAGVQFTVCGRGGHFSADELTACLRSEDPSGHVAPTGLVMVENTHNRGGGKIMDPEAFEAISLACQGADVPLHIDGARLANAAAGLGVPPTAWTARADSVTFCLSKGLGAPVGSVLCGSEGFIRRAHRYRKMLGGGMRQAGVLAAAGLHALEHHLDDLAHDHRRARALAEALAGLPGVSLDSAAVQTNIVIFTLTGMTPQALCAAVAPAVRVLPFGPQQVRAVFHRDVDDDGLARAIAAFQRALG